MPDAEAAAKAAPRRRWSPGLIDLYLVRGAIGTFFAISLAVVAAMMLERTLRLIQELAARGADIGYLLPLLWRLVPYYLDLAMPAAFLVALILLVARLDERLELEAMLASGLSLSRLATPLVALGLLVGLVNLVIGGWLEPLGRYEFRSMRIEAVNAGRIGRLAPRALYHPDEGLAVTFDRRGADGGIGGLFVWQQLEDGRELVLTGSRGWIGFSAERRRLEIELQGGRYVADRPDSSGAAQVLAFRQISLGESLQLDDPRWRRGLDHNELTLGELHAIGRDGTASIPGRAIEAEYYSRIARAAIVPLLPLLVLPLAFAPKRGRRTLGVLLCGAMLAAMLHAVDFVRGLALAGVVDPRAAILGTAALAGACVLLIFVSGRHLPGRGPIPRMPWPARRGPTPTAGGSGTVSGLGGGTIATYLARELAVWSLMALLAVVALLQMVDLFEHGDDFVTRRFGTAEIARFALLRLPTMVQQALPIAALAGAMAAFARLARQREMTAMRAAGISQWRILRMALPVALAIAAATWLVAEQAVPRSQLAFAAWWPRTAPAAAAPAAERRWFRIGDEIARASLDAADGTRLRDVSLYRRDAAGLLETRVRAASAEANRGIWLLNEVRIVRFGQAGRARETRLDRALWSYQPRPEDVAAFFATSATLSTAAAQRSLAEAAPASHPANVYATRINRRFAQLLGPIVMLMLALPMAFAAPQTGPAWPAVLYAAGGGLLYLVADGVLTVAGQVGYWPAALGAWTAPVLGLMGTLTVLVYTER